MTDLISFQTRARTIDHLGREQIADVPTAVSELWKNAYDAYARSVALHIYAGESPIALIADDGHGMSREDFVTKWLVVGTDSKVSSSTVSPALRQGRAERLRQGQKGIGRLSVAALGSSALVVSKREATPFVASMIDWRLFENPFSLLHDILLPVNVFEENGGLVDSIPPMTAALLGNLGHPDGDERSRRLYEAWAAFDAIEGEQDANALTTSQRIRQSAAANMLGPAGLADWSVWSGADPSGTAILISDINSALSAWVLEGDAAADEGTESVRASLQRTLTGFSDPYTIDARSPMTYGVIVHKNDSLQAVITADDGYNRDFLHSLDHFIEGVFDENGVFTGSVKAFGKDQEPFVLTPAQFPPTSARDRVGPFSITIGAFEPQVKSSTLPPEVHERVATRAETHSGLSVYRDGLRVMPYGRPENDFFKIEERRQKQAGREFWASRRMFGSIAISRSQNPNLRDKAGREGLIDNAASRTMQLLIIDFLKATARRYYGSDADVRQDLLPAIEAENEKAAAAAKLTRTRITQTFQRLVRAQSPELNDALAQIASVESDLEVAVSEGDEPLLVALGDRIESAIRARSNLRLPAKPKRLGRFEETYRDYRDRFSALATDIDRVKLAWGEACTTLRNVSPSEVAKSHFGRNQKAVMDAVNAWHKDISNLQLRETKRLKERAEADRKNFYRVASPLMTQLEAGTIGLEEVLSELVKLREQMIAEFGMFYAPYLAALTHLSEGVDLESAFAYAGARQATLERELEQVQSLAQVGISVEILGHELRALDNRLAASLAMLSTETQNSEAFKAAERARLELVERLRFLSQMQIAGGDVRQRITGLEIVTFLLTFFSSILDERGIDLVHTSEFDAIAFHEFPSRIFPVFTNLVNNSIHWLSGRLDKRIKLSVVDGAIVLSDTGQGVDAEDVDSLFELFFSRRARGRGVGLYLCRRTLAAGGHVISYETEGRRHVLEGANFSIVLRDGFDG